MRNQAEDSFLLNHLEQNAPAEFSRPRNKLKESSLLWALQGQQGEGDRAAGFVSRGTLMGWILLLTLLDDRGVAACTQVAL